LVSRGFKTLKEVHDYLYAKLPDLHDPFLFNQMPQAVDRVVKAIDQGEDILIYGDNDVDGMTGTALLTEFLQHVGAKVHFFVSNRGALRQNLIIEALKTAHEKNVKLLITVDCGITAALEVSKVVSQGIDLIITDHHEPTEEIPKCIAILNPKLPQNTYPNRELTGVGVAFKLAHAIANQLVEEGKLSLKKIDMKRYLDLVALGTISDMGALTGENRILVRYGIKQLKKPKHKRIGLTQLIKIANVDLNDLSTFTIASKLAPRLNSLGRIDDPQKGVEMLLVRQQAIAEKMAIELDLNNIERQKIEKTMLVDVENTLQEHPETLQSKAVVMSSSSWHPGVIAIISTRISRLYNRPTIMIAVDNDIGKGSGRSIFEFPLLAAFKECSDLLINYGGHDFAAGLTIKKENIPEFKRRFIEMADAKLEEHDVASKLYLDAEVRFKDLTFDFMEALNLFEPYGNENPQPILYCEAKQAWPPKVVGKYHLKLFLEQGDRMLEGIAFGKGHLSPHLRRKDLTLKIAFTPQINNYQGQSIQLMIRDFQIL
jgi:single-stranded-DNA-specific exonuclease